MLKDLPLIPYAKRKPYVKRKAIQKKKIDKYAELIFNEKKLIKSSQSIIKKKHSPLALKIKKGNVKAIVRAVKDKIYGILNKEQRNELCEMICDLKNRLKNLAPNQNVREGIVYGLSFILAQFEQLSAFMIDIIWYFRSKLYEIMCNCNLDQTRCKAV